jgi:hypothetical protein
VTSARTNKLALKAFLSHRYKSPEINLFFFNLFATAAHIQFEVDVGTKRINVTRIERMIREADAFIGIYPLPGDATRAPPPAYLAEKSQYFRLELDMAIRSRKPGLVFYDQRYGDTLRPPRDMLCRPFDSREVLNSAGYAHEQDLLTIIGSFLETVSGWKKYWSSQAIMPRPDKRVGLVLPPEHRRGRGYAARHFEEIQTTLKAKDWEVERLPWPPVLEHRLFSKLREVDWVLADIGSEVAQTGIVSYLHGQFMPLMRLKRVPQASAKDGQSHFEETMFGGVKVGYREDLLRWHDLRSLRKGIALRLDDLDAETRFIGTTSAAENYFREAALRKERVFLSYTGADAAVAAPLSQALKQRFQEVFDYKDGKSIQAGKDWLPEIFEKLSQSPVGVLLLSSSYLASGNCRHEAQEMIAQRDAGRMTLLPINARGEALKLPPWLGGIQYLGWDYSGPDEALKRIIQLIDGPPRT